MSIPTPATPKILSIPFILFIQVKPVPSPSPSMGEGWGEGDSVPLSLRGAQPLMVRLSNHVVISFRLNPRRQTTIATATRLPRFTRNGSRQEQ